MSQLFKPLSQIDEQFLLASHMPPGRLFEKVFDIDDLFGKLLLAIAVEFVRGQAIKEDLFNEMDINKTEDLIEEWERSVGIPDECFSANISLPKRRNQVLQKFSKFGGVQLSEDFVRVALSFGLEITVSPGSRVGLFPLIFPIVLIDGGAKEAKHTIVVIINNPSVATGFPIPFPYTFTGGDKEFLQCLFNKLAPANVKVVIQNIGEI